MKLGASATRPSLQELLPFPAPTGGLNRRDSLDAMANTDALELINWIPEFGGLSCRKGFREWATGLADPVQTIIPYMPSIESFDPATTIETATSVVGELFAATKNGIYDISSTTDNPTEVLDLTPEDAPPTTYGGHFSFTNLSNSGGNWLLLCCEDGGYFTYDGTTWTKRVTGADPGEIDGVDPDDLVFVSLWKRRAWFVEKDSAKVWYLPVDSITGTAASLDLGPLMKQGGAVSYIVSWTIDAGEGLDDHIAFITEEGEVIVYKGTDPSSAETFALIGVWGTASIPKGRRAFCYFGGDVLILTAGGLHPLSQIVQGGVAGPDAEKKDYLSKVQEVLSEYVRQTHNIYGWQLTHFAKRNLLHIRVPPALGFLDKHFAMQTTLSAWTELRGFQTSCYGVHSSLMFGGTEDGRVLVLHNGDFDNVPLNPTGDEALSYIYTRVVPAFTPLNSPHKTKRALLATLRFRGLLPPVFGIKGLADFKYGDEYFDAIESIPTWENDSGIWNVSLWDEGIWAGGDLVYSFGRALTGVGEYLSYCLDAYCIGGLKLHSVVASCEVSS